MTGIIVGADGSEHSRLALDWAMREAALRQVPLTVITVLPVPVRPATEIYWPVPEFPGGRAASERKAAENLREMVDKVASETRENVPGITVTAITGDPAEELVRAARDADMLVVGSRGSGGFSRLVMGSVSNKVAHHAGCPVVIVPANRTA